MDRFKFRAVVAVEYMDAENNNGVMYPLLFDNVAINSFGNVEVFNNEITVALDKACITGRNRTLAECALRNAGVSFDSVCTTFRPTAILQCTGLTCSRGRPVYDGDRLLDKQGQKYSVIWKDAGFFARADGDFMPDIPLTQKWLYHWELQIIGTIYAKGKNDDD